MERGRVEEGENWRYGVRIKWRGKRVADMKWESSGGGGESWRYGVRVEWGVELEIWSEGRVEGGESWRCGVRVEWRRERVGDMKWASSGGGGELEVWTGGRVEGERELEMWSERRVEEGESWRCGVKDEWRRERDIKGHFSNVK